MPLHDLNEFLRLSEVLNLQLSVRTAGRANIASVVTHKWRLDGEEKTVLEKVLGYLGEAYGHRRRRLGPPALLHPLRATTLLVRAEKCANLLDLLTCLLHDKLEDLSPRELGQERWRQLEDRFSLLMQDIDPEDKWFLMERLDWLTRREGETYFLYVGRLLEHARRTTELVRIKLADRLDNTLDLHVDIEDPLQGIDFFSSIFQVLFVNDFSGARPHMENPVVDHLTGAERLYQLFKNAVLMSLVRQRQMTDDDQTARVLFEAIAQASIKEAQRIVLDIFARHLVDLPGQRTLVMDVMDYAQKGRMDKVTLPGPAHRLDGLFLSHFNDADPENRKANLARLEQAKEAMAEAALAFIVIFQGFLNDSSYYVQGISEQGIHPA